MSKLAICDFIEAFNTRLNKLIMLSQWDDALNFCDETESILVISGHLKIPRNIYVAIENARIKVKRERYRAKYMIAVDDLEDNDEKDTDN